MNIEQCIDYFIYAIKQSETSIKEDNITTECSEIYEDDSLYFIFTYYISNIRNNSDIEFQIECLLDETLHEDFSVSVNVDENLKCTVIIEK